MTNKDYIAIANNRFVYFIFAQKVIIVGLALGVFFSIGTLILYLYAKNIEPANLIVPLFCIGASFYVVIINTINSYRIFSLFRKLKKYGILYDIKILDARIYQDDIRTTAYRQNQNVALPFTPENRKVLLLKNPAIMILLVKYKEYRFYTKWIKPLWIDIEKNSIRKDLRIKGVKIIEESNIKFNDKTLIIEFTKGKIDFRRIEVFTV